MIDKPIRVQRGWYSRGYLPHLDAVQVIQHITFHLADSLPDNALQRMHDEIALITPSGQSRKRRERLQEMLDSGLGCCLLADRRCADLVEQSLLHGDGERYRLLAWVVMPNHVHVLIETLPQWPLGKVVQSWKRHTSRRIRDLVPAAPGPFWQRDFWDRYIRNDEHLAAALRYIEQNPVSAGLTESAEQWEFGSARLRLARRAGDS